MGETKFASGMVVRVEVGVKGVHYDLKDVGDVRRLAGRMIEIHGPAKLYDGRAEIILNRISRITGGASLIPPIPKNYDVENRGHYSAGRLRPSKNPKKAKAKPN